MASAVLVAMIWWARKTAGGQRPPERIAVIFDSEVANDLHSTANTAVSAGFAGLPFAERFIGNLEINNPSASASVRPM
jgi:hypothetical protein